MTRSHNRRDLEKTGHDRRDFFIVRFIVDPGKSTYVFREETFNQDLTQHETDKAPGLSCHMKES